MQSYDYIILGGGASGLSLAHRMIQHEYFHDKKIALVEKDRKTSNDRTWCFWEEGKGNYEDIVSKKWPRLTFYSTRLEKDLDITPFEYKMIRGIDFYNKVYPDLEAAANIEILYAEVNDLKESQDSVIVSTTEGELTGNHIFKSYPDEGLDTSSHLYVDQHFKGFFIETSEPQFDADRAIFMDFRIEQEGEARFLYVLPQTETRALVEVAIFSNNILEQSAYDKILKDYIKEHLEITEYKIEEEEFGVIPMTTYPFHKHNTALITHIGTGGGVVKSSSGYAFQRVQRHSDQLIECMVLGRPMSESYKGLRGRFLMYDKVMLHAMLKGGVSGTEIFTKLFEKKKAADILKFLNQDTNFLEELNIFTAPPWWPFTKAFFKELV